MWTAVTVALLMTLLAGAAADACSISNIPDGASPP
jgi:hypothetical protein